MIAPKSLLSLPAELFLSRSHVYMRGYIPCLTGFYTGYRLV